MKYKNIYELHSDLRPASRKLRKILMSIHIFEDMFKKGRCSKAVRDKLIGALSELSDSYELLFRKIETYLKTEREASLLNQDHPQTQMMLIRALGEMISADDVSRKLKVKNVLPDKERKKYEHFLTHHVALV